VSGCSCSNNLNEESDPALDEYKRCLKSLGDSIKSAHKTKEGKQLSIEYWKEVVKLLKKAKLGISMIELGIDSEEELETNHDTTIKKVKPTPAGEKGEGGPRDGDKSDEPTEKPKGDDSDDDDEENKDDENSNAVNEKSSSKSQQRLFGMVHAYNKGDLKKGDVDSDLYDKVKKIATGMTKTDAEDMAKTDHVDLPEKVPTDELHDILNHLSILLSEQSFDNVESNGSEFSIDTNNRKFTIKFDDKFFMVAEKYNYELGDPSDLNEVVNTFRALIQTDDFTLIEEYKKTIS
jgi:hypothetical protein